MKIVIILTLLCAALAVAETNDLYVATIRSTSRSITNTFVLSNIVTVAECGDRAPCWRLLYLKGGKTNWFHTGSRFDFTLRPQ